MYKKMPVTLLCVILLLSACKTTGSSGGDTSGSDNPFAGTYRGEEVLAGGTFPIRIIIKASGDVMLIDVDNISGRGKLDGEKFIINRPTPYQVFEGTISGTTITGKTHGNAAFGDGTFSATRS